MNPRLNHVEISDSAIGKGVKLSYWGWGESSNPATICVHGLTRNGRDFDFLAQSLAETRRVLCPDLPGRGQSDWLADTDNYNYNTYTSCLLKMIEATNSAPVDWVGSSLGGIVGMRIAAERPQLIRKLVLNDVGAVLPLEGLRRINSYVGMIMNFAGRAAAEEHIRDIYANFGITKDTHWQHLLNNSFTELSNGEYQLSYDPGILDPLRDKAKNLQLDSDGELWEWWDEISCPVLILRGETSDILRPETAEEMLTRNSNAELITIPNVGHAPSLMQESQIDLVKQWLEKA